MAKPLDPAVAHRNTAALRLVEANRARFDSAETPPGAMEGRIQALEAEAAAAHIAAAEARHRLHLFETARIWRLTRPVRWLIEAARVERVRPPVPVEPPRPPTEIAALSYQAWVRDEEPARLAALREAGRGHQAIRPQRLGLVLVGAPGPDAPDVPAGCAVLRVAASDDRQRLVAQALDQLDVDLIGFLDTADQMAPGALSLVATVLAQYPQTDLIFADEDWLDAAGRRVRPFFKPGWDAELQRGRDLVGPFAFYRAALVRRASVAAGPAWRYDLANQVAAATAPERIRHVPAMLCHRGTLPPGHADAMRAATAAQLARDGVAARVEPAPGRPGHQRIIYALPQPAPLVSVIVPTRDRADLLRVCADAVLAQTDYPRLQLLLVDNDTVEPEAAALLATLAEDARVRVLRSPGVFNWSRMNNQAAQEADGEVLVLLNNDIAVLQPEWLATLVSHAVQPGIGAVGAKLLYPDGRIQHAGLTTDSAGVPRHLFRYAPGEAAGAFDLLASAREVWGVTGACMALRREVFFAVGGLNEALPVAYNDVELCLRLTAHGYRIVWTPWAVVEHREMASRPPDSSPGRKAQVEEERDRLMRDWGALVLQDPFMNPNLRLLDEQPCLVPHSGRHR